MSWLEKRKLVEYNHKFREGYHTAVSPKYVQEIRPLDAESKTNNSFSVSCPTRLCRHEKL